MLWVRNVRDRLTKLAPFLSYDGDPYPVVVDGRVKWVVDAYTTTSRYPYAQRIGNEVQLTRDSGLDRDANYVRNSVKAVVDAYDGSVHVLRQRPRRPDHPGVGGRRSATCSRPATRCRPSCASTCATPRTCSGCRPTCTRSTSSSRSDFFEREGAWSVAQAPGVDPREPTTGAATPSTTPDRRADAGRARLGVVDEPVHPVLHDVPRPRRARAPSSCCCGRSCRSRATTSAPSCRRT